MRPRRARRPDERGRVRPVADDDHRAQAGQIVQDRSEALESLLVDEDDRGARIGQAVLRAPRSTTTR
jgi:hypothetical protein